MIHQMDPLQVSVKYSHLLLIPVKYVLPFEMNKTPFFSLHDAALLNCPAPFKVPEFLCDIELVQSKQGISCYWETLE